MDNLVKGLSKFLSSSVFPFFLAMVVGAIVFTLVRRWLHFRNHRKARDEQIATLKPVSARLGGTVIGQDEGDTAAWSAGVLGPVVEHVEGWYATWLRRSKPQWDLAMDFRRGPWHVRVTEASVRVAAYSGYGVRWEQEHRIEVATARMAPMRVVRPRKRGTDGQPLSPKEFESQWASWLAERPVSAQDDHVEWHRVRLAPPMDKEFFASGSDPSAVHRELNFDALSWLLDREEDLPVRASWMQLTFESGLVYIVLSNHIDEDELMVVVDTICGLLDRMPGARPRHPAAAV